MNITIYKRGIPIDPIVDFQNIIFDSELIYLASELPPFKSNDSVALEKALKRAMLVCCAADIPLRQNFKKVYHSKNGQIQIDWRLSSLGRKLLLINADPSNPIIARLQLELIGHL